MITNRIRIFSLTAFLPAAALFAAQGAGVLPVYPGAHAIAPAAATSIHLSGATTLLDSSDSLQKVDGWFKAHAMTRCARILAYNLPKFDEAHADIRYACPDGSITLHSEGGGTQIGYVASAPPKDVH